MSDILEEFEAVFVGSGFGAAVMVHRLAPVLGGKSCILERGRKYEADDFPRLKLPEYLSTETRLTTSLRVPDVSRASWSLDQGLFDLRNLGRLRVVQAAGWGGGSLIYASVHLRPPASTFNDWPDEYAKHPLDEEYERVAEKLSVQPLPPDRRLVLPKARLMRQAAERLQRPQCDGPAQTNFFYPPLAITFGRCDDCGECTIGCRRGAKNTLDKNYLSEAETTAGDKLSVRPLSEVLRIENAREATAGRYVVVYYDHIEHRQRKLSAQYVFLGAGALGTTEILFRSHRHGLKPDESGWANRSGLERLGKSFFGNGDNLGVVFDTDGCAEPSRGPTITTAVMHVEVADPPPQPSAANHAEPRRAPTWFLVQDGGVPGDLQQLLGAFRSPQWLGRNRWTTARRLDSSASKPETTRCERALSLAHAATDLLLRQRRKPAPPARQPIPSEWIAALPPSVRSWARLLRDLSDRARSEFLDFDRQVLDALAPETFYLSKGLVGSTRVLEHVAAALALRYPPLRYLLREHMGLATLADVATYLALGGPVSARTMVLLVMGPDPAGTLRFDRHERLRVDWHAQDSPDDELFALQERLMRDFALELGGELRTNPDWTIGRHAVSVHVQGGCSMSPCPAQHDKPKGVTRPDGRVFGFEGIYVVDAAAFPASVGANPSATIAAVAERKARWFAEAYQSSGASEKASLTHLTPMAAERSAAPFFRLSSAATTARIRSTPIGITWSENLHGYLVARSGATGKTGVPRRRLELERPPEHGSIPLHMQLTVKLPDFEVFARAFQGRRARLPCAAVGGTVSIAGEQGTLATNSALEFLVHRDSARGELHVHGMRYDLRLADAVSGIDTVMGRKFFHEAPGQAIWSQLTTLFVWAGSRVAHNHGSNGALASSASKRQATSARVLRHTGIARVSLRDFINLQLPSFNADVESAAQTLRDGGRTADECRPDELARAWALARFSWLVFRGITQEYAR